MLAIWVVVACFASLLALLAIPVDLTFAVHRDARRQESSGSLGWLFGLVRLHLRKPKVGARETRGRSRGDLSPRKRGAVHRAKAVLRVEGFAWRLLRFARDLLYCVRVRDLSLNVRLGLDDPADTGRLWAVVGPLAAALATPSFARVHIQPEFAAEALEIDGKGCLRVIPIQVLFLVFVFVLSPITLRALRTITGEAW